MTSLMTSCVTDRWARGGSDRRRKKREEGAAVCAWPAAGLCDALRKNGLSPFREGGRGAGAAFLSFFFDKPFFICFKNNKTPTTF